MRIPKGFKYSTICSAILKSPITRFELVHIRAPAGTAHNTALHRTGNVLSIIEVYIVCNIRGGR